MVKIRFKHLFDSYIKKIYKKINNIKIKLNKKFQCKCSSYESKANFK